MAKKPKAPLDAEHDDERTSGGEGNENDNGSAEAAEAGDETAQADPVDIDEGFEQLKVLLTDAEKINAGERITRLYAQQGQLESQLAGIKKQIGADIEKVEGELADVVGMLRDGYRYDAVAIETRKDWRVGELYKLRKDTGEIYFRRAISGEERQRKLFEEKREAAEQATGADQPGADDAAGDAAYD